MIAKASSVLENFVGNWSVSMRTHEKDGTVTKSKDLISVRDWFADKRYVCEQIKGEFSGTLHQKLTLFSFNTTLSRFEYLTADNHDTALLLYVSRPCFSDEIHEIELFAQYISPGDAAPKGVQLTVRTVIKIESQQEHGLRNYYAEPGQPERLFLEYSYKKIL